MSQRSMPMPPKQPKHEHWANRTEFILSIMGYTVGLGNVWRFPTLAARSGGGAFVMPYLILQLVIGLPIYFMELCMGQYSGLGPVGVWKMVPAFKGLGLAKIIRSTLLAFYYPTIMAYAVHYMVTSSKSVLPWSVCTEEWLTLGCYTLFSNESLHVCTNTTYMTRASSQNIRCVCNGSISTDFDPINTCFTRATYKELVEKSKSTSECRGLLMCTNITTDPADFYFDKEILNRSSSLNEMGTPSWSLTYCLLLTWFIICLCSSKGIRTSGKVVYVTVTVPILILIILLIEVVGHQGAIGGLKFFVIPNWSSLADFSVWSKAAEQVFFSLSISYGGLTLLASYNSFHNNLLLESFFVITVDCLISFVSGCVVFGVLGSIAHHTGTDIRDVQIPASFNLPFATYPRALLSLKPAMLWSSLFFLMLLMLGIDSQFTTVEVFYGYLLTQFTYFQRHKVTICAITCTFCFLMGLPFLCPGGTYLTETVEAFAGITVSIIVLLELIAVHWIYRVDRFLQNIAAMLQKRLYFEYLWIFVWNVFGPVILLILLSLNVTGIVPLKYSDGRLYETSAQVIATVIFVITIAPIPICFIWTISNAPGDNFCSKLQHSLSPADDWGPQLVSDENDDKLQPIIQCHNYFGGRRSSSIRDSLPSTLSGAKPNSSVTKSMTSSSFALTARSTENWRRKSRPEQSQLRDLNPLVISDDHVITDNRTWNDHSLSETGCVRSVTSYESHSTLPGSRMSNILENPEFDRSCLAKSISSFNITKSKSNFSQHDLNSQLPKTERASVAPASFLYRTDSTESAVAQNVKNIIDNISVLSAMRQLDKKLGSIIDKRSSEIMNEQTQTSNQVSHSNSTINTSLTMIEDQANIRDIVRSSILEIPSAESSPIHVLQPPNLAAVVRRISRDYNVVAFDGHDRSNQRKSTVLSEELLMQKVKEECSDTNTTEVDLAPSVQTQKNIAIVETTSEFSLQLSPSKTKRLKFLEALPSISNIGTSRASSMHESIEKNGGSIEIIKRGVRQHKSLKMKNRVVDALLKNDVFVRLTSGNSVGPDKKPSPAVEAKKNTSTMTFLKPTKISDQDNQKQDNPDVLFTKRTRRVSLHDRISKNKLNTLGVSSTTNLKSRDSATWRDESHADEFSSEVSVQYNQRAAPSFDRLDTGDIFGIAGRISHDYKMTPCPLKALEQVDRRRKSATSEILSRDTQSIAENFAVAGGSSVEYSRLHVSHDRRRASLTTKASLTLKSQTSYELKPVERQRRVSTIDKALKNSVTLKNIIQDVQNEKKRTMIRSLTNSSKSSPRPSLKPDQPAAVSLTAESLRLAACHTSRSSDETHDESVSRNGSASSELQKYCSRRSSASRRSFAL